MARRARGTSDDCPPLYFTPPPSDRRGDRNYVKGAWFDQAAVDHVVAALSDLRHTKGRWRGVPLVPDPWQLKWILAPVFGWKYSDGRRIVRTLWEEVPKKNGKSTTASGLSLVLAFADREPAADVYAAATAEGQARIVFDEGGRMAMASPGLMAGLQVLTSVIRAPATGSIFRVLSSVAEVQHGLNVHAAVVDEVHAHKKRDLIDTLRTGTASREQPLLILITTADEGDEETIYAEYHQKTVDISNGLYDDPTFCGRIWAAPDDADPFDEETWRKANPGLGTTVSLEYLRQEAENAKRQPRYFPVFCRFHLNRRMKSTSAWLRMDRWNDPVQYQPVSAKELEGHTCFAGLDLSATTDLTSFQLFFPFDPERDDEWEVEDEEGEIQIRRPHKVLSWFWLPGEDLQERVERDHVPYDEWARNGFIRLTEGNAIDYDAVEQAILEEAIGKYRIRRLSYDRMFAGATVTNLGEHVEVAPVSQTFVGLSPAAKELERLNQEGELQHGGHPVLKWNAEVVEVLTDNHDNIKPVKPKRDKTSKRVDGISALVMGIDGWVRYRDEDQDATALVVQ